MPHHHDESIQYALPNSRSSFFDNSVVQKFEAVSEIHSHYHTTDYIRDTYEYKMMQHSGECVSFCVGGPRYFEALTIVETFDQWSSWNHSKDFLAMNNSGNLRQGSRIHCLEKCSFVKDVNNSVYCSEIWPTN